MEAIVQYMQANIVLVLFLVFGLRTVVGKLKAVQSDKADQGRDSMARRCP